MIVAIGTRKGLWLAEGAGEDWTLIGPHFPMQEVTALARLDTGASPACWPGS